MVINDLDNFLNDLASSSPTPGGGGATALIGVLGIALGRMVANLTSGKKSAKPFQREIDDILVEAEHLQNDLTLLVNKDAEVFAPLARAYKLPKTTKKEKLLKEKVMESALKEACTVPFDTMQVITNVIDVLDRLSEIGTKNAISDIGLGVLMCQVVLKGSNLNVRINTRLMKNRIYAEELNNKADHTLAEQVEKTNLIYKKIEAYLR